jgi:Surp module
MEIPPTLKLNQIIEKTAKFISSQGPQMEILLKTKQASNPQFDFLNHNGKYNSYYKHILGMMKAATYPWQEFEVKSEENSQDAVDYNINASSPAPSTSSIIIPKMVFKPSADCTYTQLISKITKAPIAEIEKQKRQENETEKAKNGGGVIEVKKPLFGLVHYSSDSESEEEEEQKTLITYTGIIPPSELQLVIDKTAIYVAKNGIDFEETLRKKNDMRFQFLDFGNEFHEYYAFKVTENGGPIAQKPLPSKVEPAKLPKTPPAPVCFSIKPKEEKSPLKPTVLQLQMTSSDDENKEKLPNAPTPPRITSVEEELEMQVDAMNAEREEKAAKAKLTDKLLNAAREKLGMFPKEKMLQIERKKKALMFMKQIKGSNGNSTNGGGKEDEIHSVGDSDDDSVKSIPVASSSSSAPPKETRSRSRFVIFTLAFPTYC